MTRPAIAPVHDPVEAIRQALAEELTLVGEVDLAQLSFDGSHVIVRAYTIRPDLALAERLSEVDERLGARFPDLTFEVIPRQYQGRGLAMLGGSPPDYQRRAG